MAQQKGIVLMQMLDPRHGQNDSLSGLDLLRSCQVLAGRHTQQVTHPFLLPCGARIFYYTRLALLRRGVQPAVEPTKELVSQPIASSFLCLAPHVADRLAEEFGWAVQLLKEPAVVAPQLLLQRPQPATPALQKLLTAQAGLTQLAPQEWSVLWQASLQQIQAQRFSALEAMLSPMWLLVAPVAGACDPFGVALHLLRARLAQDAARGSQIFPLLGVYVYDEPLVQWLMRRLLVQPWFKDYWQAGAVSLRRTKLVSSSANEPKGNTS